MHRHAAASCRCTCAGVRFCWLVLAYGPHVLCRGSLVKTSRRTSGLLVGVVGACDSVQHSACRVAGTHKMSTAPVALSCNRAAKIMIKQYLMHCFIPQFSLSRTQRYNKYCSICYPRITKNDYFYTFYPKSIPFPEIRCEKQQYGK